MWTLFDRFRCGDPYIWTRCEPDWHVGLWLGGRARGQIHLPPPGVTLVTFTSHTMCLLLLFWQTAQHSFRIFFLLPTQVSAQSSWRQSEKSYTVLYFYLILFLLALKTMFSLLVVCEGQYWCVSCSCVIATTQWSQCQLQYFHQLWLEVTSGGSEVSFREWRTRLFCRWAVWDRIWRCSRWWVSPGVANGCLLSSNVVLYQYHISLGCSTPLKTRIKFFLPSFFIKSWKQGDDGGCKNLYI